MLNKAASTRASDHTPDLRAELMARLDEAALLQGALQRDRLAWREFMRRYEPVARQRISRVLASRKSAHSSAVIDEVMSDFYLRLLDDDMRKLRKFDPSRGAALRTWLAMVA